MCETAPVRRHGTFRERWEGIALLAVCAFVLSACGGDDATSQAQNETQTTAQTTGQSETETTARTETETGSTGSGNTVSAERYVASICSSLKTLQRQIEMNRKEYTASISATTGAAGVRKSIVAFLDEAIAAIDRLALRVSRAGTPDVEHGDQAAAALRRSLRDVKVIFLRLRVQVRKLPVDDVTALTRRLEVIASSTQPRLAALTKTFERLSTGNVSPELRRAVTNSPACTGLRP
jgi:hypothetical protein